MRLLIPPPIVALMFAGIIWLLDWIFPGAGFTFLGQFLVALILVLLGFSIALLAARTFRHANTQIDPRDPEKSTSVVQNGVFAYSRNPMYLGLALVLGGVAVWIGNLIGIPVLILFVAYITRFQIIPEEEILSEKFGSAYSDYLAKVRRWI